MDNGSYTSKEISEMEILEMGMWELDKKLIVGCEIRLDQEARFYLKDCTGKTITKSFGGLHDLVNSLS